MPARSTTILNEAERQRDQARDGLVGAVAARARVTAALRAQQRPQPGYRNADIAAGAQDPYIRRMAGNLGKFPGTVYLRYAHEMNGFWYPWSHDARGVRACVAADRSNLP